MAAARNDARGAPDSAAVAAVTVILDDHRDEIDALLEHGLVLAVGLGSRDGKPCVVVSLSDDQAGTVAARILNLLPLRVGDAPVYFDVSEPLMAG